MKRFWIGIVLLCMSLMLCVTEQRLTTSMTKDMTAYLDNITTAANTNNYTLADNLNKELKSSWKNFKKPLAIFVSHDILNDVTESLNILEAEILNKDIFFDSNYAKVKTQIDSIEEDGKLLIENVL